MSKRTVMALTIILAALVAQYNSLRPKHQIAIVSESGDFQFFADAQPDGTYTYETSYIYEHGWLLEPQYEAGQLSPKDWHKLESVHHHDQLPIVEESVLGEPDEVWGVMKRRGETIVLRYAEWWDLSGTQVPESYWSMGFKAKNSL